MIVNHEEPGFNWRNFTQTLADSHSIFGDSGESAKNALLRGRESREQQDQDLQNQLGAITVKKLTEQYAREESQRKAQAQLSEIQGQARAQSAMQPPPGDANYTTDERKAFSDVGARHARGYTDFAAFAARAGLNPQETEYGLKSMDAPYQQELDTMRRTQNASRLAAQFQRGAFGDPASPQVQAKAQELAQMVLDPSVHPDAVWAEADKLAAPKLAEDVRNHQLDLYAQSMEKDLAGYMASGEKPNQLQLSTVQAMRTGRLDPVKSEADWAHIRRGEASIMGADEKPMWVPYKDQEDAQARQNALRDRLREAEASAKEAAAGLSKAREQSAAKTGLVLPGTLDAAKAGKLDAETAAIKKATETGQKPSAMRPGGDETKIRSAAINDAQSDPEWGGSDFQARRALVAKYMALHTGQDIPQDAAPAPAPEAANGQGLVGKALGALGRGAIGQVQQGGGTFADWKAKNAPKDSGQDYDLQGAYKAGVVPDAQGHMPDTFKKPNHPTFSVESEHVMEAPTKAGYWEGEKFQKPTAANLKQRAVALKESMLGRGISDAEVRKTVAAFLEANQK